jgi:regulatory protein
MADDPEVEKALQKAYRLLAARARSEKELRSKLKENKFDLLTIDKVIARLYELTYLDDGAFARQWVRHLAVDKLSGNRRIEISLQEKGIGKTLSEQVLAEIRQDVPEREIIGQVIRKKLKGGKLQRQDGREKRRLVQHLLGKGFTPDLIFEMIRDAEEGDGDDDRQSD